MSQDDEMLKNQITEKVKEAINRHKGAGFNPRITRSALGQESEIVLIEPPCGSNIAIIKSRGQYLFIDTGYSIYKDEMLPIFDSITGDFQKIEKTAFLTHSDIDHVGLLYLFDRVFLGDRSARDLKKELEGGVTSREKVQHDFDYLGVCKPIVGYTLANPEVFQVVAYEDKENKEPLYKGGELDFGEFHFEVFCGQGGHVKGENLLFDFEHHICFPGDIFVNLKNMIPDQMEYNSYAPQLIDSVESDAAMARREREALMQIMGKGTWRLFPGHGAEIRLDL